VSQTDLISSLLPFEQVLPDITVKFAVKSMSHQNQQQSRVLQFYFEVEAAKQGRDLSDLVVPVFNFPDQHLRRNELWKHTCFELFLSTPHSPGYWEVNLSPSGDWNFYSFNSYRQNMSVESAIQQAPVMSVTRDTHKLVLVAQLNLDSLENISRSGTADATDSIDLTSCDSTFNESPSNKSSELVIGATAVLEYANGVCEYWALKHCGPKPDFHLRESFCLTI
jgi:hypothetical protein